MSDYDFGAIRRTVEGAVLAFLREQHGPDALTERPIAGLTSTRLTPADWAVGITAARTFVHDIEATIVREYTTKAREEGIPWTVLATPLGVPEDDDDPGREAWFLATDPPSMPYDPRYFSYKCPSCDRRIKDYGPVSGDPTETEEGHAETCARHQAEIAAYMERVNS